MDYKKEHEEAMELYKRSDKSYWKLRKEARKTIESLKSELTASKEDNTKLREWVEKTGHELGCIAFIGGLGNNLKPKCTCGHDELLADTSKKGG